MKLSNQTKAETLVWIYLTQSTKYQRRETLSALSAYYVVTANAAFTLTERGVRFLSGNTNALWSVYAALESLGYELFAKPTNRNLVVFTSKHLPPEHPMSTLVFINGEQLYDKRNIPVDIVKVKRENAKCTKTSASSSPR